MKSNTIVTFLLLMLLAWGNLAGEPLSDISKNAIFSLESPTYTVAPGSEVQVALSCRIDQGWHLYWKNTGGTGHAPTFDWHLPDGVRVRNICWPSPRQFEQSGTTFFGYENNPQWLITLCFDADMPEGAYPITLGLFWISCNHACVPETQLITTSFEVRLGAPKPPLPKNIEEIKKQLPTHISESTASVDKEFIAIQLPLPEDVKGPITNVLVYPEEENIIPVEKRAHWQTNDSLLQVTAPLSHGAQEALLASHRFSGIIQIVTDTPAEVFSYSISAHVSEAMLPLEPSSEHLWRSLDSEEPMSEESSSPWLVLALAFLGGILLNCTPCVLPVVGIKILHLISYKNTTEHSVFSHGLSYTFGILSAFWALAGILYSLQYAGMTVGWGFQLQEPRFVIVLIAFLFCFALNLFGVFEFGTQVASWAASVESSLKASLGGVREPRLLTSFASGALATLIATPCTGPFLGSVLGFAATIHPLEGCVIFTFIGLGIAFPFLLITAFPRLIKLLPKPGNWMILTKQLFAFFVLLTILWLLFVLQAQVPTLSPLLLASGLLVIAFGFWIYGSFGGPLKGFLVRLISKTLALILLVFGSTLLYSLVDDRPLTFLSSYLQMEDAIPWQPFSKARLKKELSLNKTVFVAFTAKWCLTCQTNDLVFLSSTVREAFEQGKIVPLEADWTNGDEEITRMLRSLGRSGVPVYAIFKKDQEPVLLPEILSPKTLAEALSNSGTPPSGTI